MREFDPERLKRSFYTSSSCGVCGKGAAEAVRVHAPPVESDLRVAWALLAALPQRLREAQPTFALTGGLHAAGLFDADGDARSASARTSAGTTRSTRSSAGRSAPAGCRCATRSSASAAGSRSSSCRRPRSRAARSSSRVGAPSSLAVELAEAQGITLCGWARADRVSVYAHAERVVGSARRWSPTCPQGARRPLHSR